MKNKKENKQENFLERIPKRTEGIPWSADEHGMVILDIENKGFFNWIAQTFFHRPKVSHIHLDRFGSFVWPLIDGKKNILVLAGPVEAHFGREALPLYERLAKYFQILYNYHFITWSA